MLSVTIHRDIWANARNSEGLLAGRAGTLLVISIDN